jgi:hypothetical protein
VINSLRKNATLYVHPAVSDRIFLYALIHTFAEYATFQASISRQQTQFGENIQRIRLGCIQREMNIAKGLSAKIGEEESTTRETLSRQDCLRSWYKNENGVNKCLMEAVCH